MRGFRITSLVVLSFALVLSAPVADAHAFPDHSSPEVGSELARAPTYVQIWFDGEIEPVFSSLIVKSEAGAQVSIGQGRISASDGHLLETALPPALPPGKYLVFWSVIARDGHHTEGRFSFRVK
ncbi:MAG: copper resistance CopC family protein [Acidiferrobacterales bacterium]